MTVTIFTRWQGFDYPAADTILFFWPVPPILWVSEGRAGFFQNDKRIKLLQKIQVAIISQNSTLLDMCVLSQIMYKRTGRSAKTQCCFCQNDQFVLPQRHPCPALLSLLKFVTNWRRQGRVKRVLINAYGSCFERKSYHSLSVLFLFCIFLPCPVISWTPDDFLVCIFHADLSLHNSA